MFKVDLLKMNGISDDLQQGIRQFNRIIDEFEGIKRGIVNIGSFESMGNVLNVIQETLEDEKNKNIKMLSALQDIRDCYNKKEQNVIEYSEDSNPTAKRKLVWNEVPVFSQEIIPIQIMV